jgi:hypothetical protein
MDSRTITQTKLTFEQKEKKMQQLLSLFINIAMPKIGFIV